MTSLRAAIVGATGLVGREILAVLNERELPIRELLLYASERSAGERIEFGADEIVVQRLPAELPTIDVVFLCATAEVSDDLAADLADAGAIVIDLTPASRANPGVPLALPGDAFPERGVLAVPAPIAQALAQPLRAIAGLSALRRITATALVSASSYGRHAVDALGRETIAILNARSMEDEEAAESTIVPVEPFRSAPDVARLADESARDLRRLLGGGVPIELSAIRTPSFHGLGVALFAETAEPLSLEAVTSALREAPSVIVGDRTASTADTLGEEAIRVSDVRVDGPSLSLWVVADNLRQGAALTAVALAESALRRSRAS